AGDRAGADRGTRQRPARHGGIRLLSRRADRHPRPAVAGRPAGRPDRQSRRLRARGRATGSCRLARVGRPGFRGIVFGEQQAKGVFTMVFMINRRTALAGAATLAAFPAAAEDKKVIIGTWGGDYSRLLTKNIDSLLKGTECVHAEENADPRKAKMMAEKVLRRGTTDVQGLSANDMFDMDQQGLAEHLDYAKMPNAKNLIPAMKYPYGIGHIYSGKVVLYNPDMMAKKPESFAETLNPAMGSKLGIIDIQYQYTMMAAGLASGGSMGNFEPGKERLIACKKAGARIYPSNEAF